MCITSRMCIGEITNRPESCHTPSSLPPPLLARSQDLRRPNPRNQIRVETMAPTIRRLVAGSGARGHWSRSCACSSTVSTSSARRQNWARSRGRTWPRRPRAEAEDKESTSSDDSASFSEQLWSPARQGVQEKETSDTLSVSAASFLNPSTTLSRSTASSRPRSSFTSSRSTASLSK